MEIAGEVDFGVRYPKMKSSCDLRGITEDVHHFLAGAVTAMDSFGPRKVIDAGLAAVCSATSTDGSGYRPWPRVKAYSG